jgi:hypothetical protein
MLAPTSPAPVAESTPSADRSRLVAGTAALALLSFVTSILLGRALLGTGVHHEWNILFDADPIVYLKNFATGKTIGDWGGRSFVHPNLTNFIYPPVWAIGEVLSRLPLPLGSPPEIREQLALLVSPVFAAIRVPLLVMLLRSLGLTVGFSLGLAALDTVSFSTRLFASIPESYLLGGTVLVFVFWMTSRDLQSSSPPRLAAWAVTLFVLFGIATLNVVAGSILLGVALWKHHPPGRALAIGLAVVGLAFALNGLCYEATRRIYPSAPPFHPMGTGHLVDSWNPRASRIPGFAHGLASSYVPAEPAVRPYDDFGNTHRFAFTLEPSRAPVWALDPRPLAFLLVLGLAVAGLRRLPVQHRPLVLGAFLILGFGVVLHSFLGRELMLYTQLWKAPAIVLLAGLHYLPASLRRIVARGLPWLVLLVALNSLLLLRGMVARLQES